MKKLITRMGLPVYLGISFGIFFAISCSTTENTRNSASESITDAASYDKELRQIDIALNNNPDNPELHLEKADLLSNYARSRSNPNQRLTLYQNLHDISVYGIENFSDYSDQFKSILNRAWNDEESIAIELLQTDRSENFEQNFDKIIAHLKNAIAIKPSETVSYSLLATTFYKRGYYNEAIETLSDALQNGKDEDELSQLKEKLAYLYLESGEYDESIALYEELAEDQAGSIYIKHGLANAYMLDSQHDKASALLETLADEYPSRVSYREALSAEYFKLFSVKAEQIINGTDSVPSTDREIDALLSLLDLSNSIYLELSEQNPLGEETLFRAALFYKSASEKLQHLISSNALSSDLEDEIIVQAQEYLESSLPYWERLSEINPNNMEYMYHLYQVYVGLDMTEQYQYLERNFNF